MFKKVSIEGEKFTDREKASKFRDKGIVTVTPREKDEQEILHKLRNSIEIEFESQSYPREIYLNKVLEKEIISQITKFLSSEYILIDITVKCGCDAVKFQKRTVDVV